MTNPICPGPCQHCNRTVLSEDKVETTIDPSGRTVTRHFTVETLVDGWLCDDCATGGTEPTPMPAPSAFLVKLRALKTKECLRHGCHDLIFERPGQPGEFLKRLYCCSPCASASQIRKFA